jgi:5'(3')-deoxyribonucleotidase
MSCPTTTPTLRSSELRDVQGHEIVYVTSCQTPEEYGAKVMWLGKHGFAKGCRTVAVGKWAGYHHKYEVPNLDWLVDDNVGHCTGFKGYALLVTRSHNKRDLYPGKRIRGIGDVPMLAQYGGVNPVPQADGDESPSD